MSEHLIKCKSNAGFEDFLTKGQKYKRIARGVNSVLVEDDKGKRRWLGLLHFVQD